MKYLLILLIFLMMVGSAFGALPTTNLIANYKASQGITITGSGVSGWADQTVNGYDLLQSDDTARPIEVTVNGLDSVFFDEKHMVLPEIVLDQRALSMFVCYRTIFKGTQGYVNVGGLDMVIYQANAQLTSYDGGADSSGIFIGNAIESVGFTSGASAKFIYQGQFSDASPVAPEANTAGTGFIGLWTAPGTFEMENAHVYEIAIYSAEVSEADRNAIFDHFSDTYGALSLTEDLFIVYEGDSLTEGDGAGALDNDMDDRWPRDLARLYTTEPKQINVAKGGTRVDQMNVDPRMALTLTALSTQSNYGTRYALLWGGTNDISNGSSSAQLITDIDSWVTAVRAGDAGALIIGCTITPTTNFTSNQPLETIRLAVNVHILNSMDADVTVDLANVPELADPTDLTYYIADGVHQNETGQPIIAQAVFDAISAFENPTSTGGIRGRYTDGYRTVYRSRYN